MTDKQQTDALHRAGFTTPNLTRRSLIFALLLTFVIGPVILIAAYLLYLRATAATISPLVAEIAGEDTLYTLSCIAALLGLGFVLEVAGLWMIKRGVRDE